MPARRFGGQRVHESRGAEIALQIDPGLMDLAEHIGRIRRYPTAIRRHLDGGDVIVCLVAVDPSNEQILAAGAAFAEIDAGKILIGGWAPIIAAPIDLRNLARRHISNEQIDNRVWATRTRIALVDHGDVFSRNVEARDDIDCAFIDLRVGQETIVRAPPIASIAIHLFLRDKLRDAVSDRVCGIARWRETALSPGF